MNYIAKIDEIGLLVPPFADEPAAVDESRRLWLGRDMLDRDMLDRDVLDRGLALNRYTGHEVLLTVGTGFGEGIFGEGLFGWS